MKLVLKVNCETCGHTFLGYLPFSCNDEECPDCGSHDIFIINAGSIKPVATDRGDKPSQS